MIRNSCVLFLPMLYKVRGLATFVQEMVMLNLRTALIGACAALALVAAPLTPASAHGRHGGLVFGLAALGAAAIVGAAAIATAPVRALAAPVYAPPYYAPSPYYAAPPSYYPPPYAYYPAPPYGYYGGYYGP